MKETIDLFCDECKVCFDVEIGIGLSMLACAEDKNGGDPILCPDCCLSAQWAREAYGEDAE